MSGSGPGHAPPGRSPDDLPPPTARLSFARVTLDDLDFLSGIFGDPLTMRFYPKVYDRAEVEERLLLQIDRYARDGHGLWLVRERETVRPCAFVGLCRREIDGEALDEIGYLVHRAFWRRGYASEAAIGVRDWAFSTPGRERVISLIRPVNVPSRGVALRLGMRRAGATVYAGWAHDIWAVSRPAGVG